jgi:hypothetical protein
MKFDYLILAGLGIAMAGCGAAAPTLTIGPNHISETLGVNSPDLTGTYKVTGEFMGEPSDGATLTIRKLKQYQQFIVERRFLSGELQARGVGIVDGDSLYVAWSTDELADLEHNDGTPLYFSLYVIALTKDGLEGVGGLSRDVFSGTYGSSKPPGQLQDKESADYRTVHSNKSIRLSGESTNQCRSADGPLAGHVPPVPRGFRPASRARMGRLDDLLRDPRCRNRQALSLQTRVAAVTARATP